MRAGMAGGYFTPTTDDDFSILHFLTQFFYSAPEQLEIGFRTKKLHWGKHYFMYERWALSKAWTYFFFCTFLLFHLERIHAYAFNTENIVLNEVMWNEINMTSKGYFFLVVLIRKCWIYDAVRHNETSEALKQVVRFFLFSARSFTIYLCSRGLGIAGACRQANGNGRCWRWWWWQTHKGLWSSQLFCCILFVFHPLSVSELIIYIFVPILVGKHTKWPTARY